MMNAMELLKKELKNEIYKELAESLESASDVDLYNRGGVEEQLGKRASIRGWRS